MSAAISPPDAAAPLERSRGVLRVRIARHGQASVLAGLYQEGCLKARFPSALPGAPASIVLMNNAGGVASGDRLDSAVALGEGAAASVTSAGAERFYRRRPGDEAAHVTTQISLGAGAALEWLPQESILFEAASLDRTLSVEIADDAQFLAVEALLFGRAAMGEAVHRLDIVDRVRIRRAGRLVWHDTVRLAGDAASLLHHAAIGGGARAVAGILFVAPDAAMRLDALRQALADGPCRAGATFRDGVLFARLLADDGAALREGIAAGLAVLRADRMLPRNWRC